ncbi:MAG: hypothetical protein AAF559_04805 [Pseudomonadota bacterium]
MRARRAATSDMNERAMLKAEIVHLKALRKSLPSGRGFTGKRKPPEAGLPVPAVPPKGPLPKQGGAAAALKFDRD